MRGRDKYCITVSGTTNEEIWKEVRYVLGPTNVDDPNLASLMNEDIDAYTNWTSTNWSAPFDKWLIWRIRVGTDSYGNLPENKRMVGKVGHCWLPCPYSTQSDDIRTRAILKIKNGESLPIRVDHEVNGINYFMKNELRGSRWGYECTSDNCSYYILTGRRYFYV